MAKKAAELTDANKAVLDARQKHALADKAHTEKPNDTTKKALENAKNTLASAVKVENRERFVRVEGGRVRKARAAIRNLANAASPRSYEYDESDIAKIESVLNDELKRSIGKMRAAKSGTGATKAEDDFTF